MWRGHNETLWLERMRWDMCHGSFANERSVSHAYEMNEAENI
jgi:hypothetical protein